MPTSLNRRNPNCRNLLETAQLFDLVAPPATVVPFGSGHIHDTYLVSCAEEGVPRYILQRLNTSVFTEPAKIMENVALVTGHLRARRARQPGASLDREILQLVPTVEGSPWLQTGKGEHWRCFPFIDRTYTLDVCTDPSQAFEAASTFGRFLRDLDDLDPTSLHETIPWFHHTPRRRTALKTAFAKADPRRRQMAEADMAFALAQESLAGEIVGRLDAGDLPLRITHNDTKLNNVLFDEDSHAGLCVIDLDTCMAGSALYDFGDMVRTICCPAAEDETDLTRVQMDLARFRKLVEGYREGAGDILTASEVKRLGLAGEVMTYTVGIRFLADYFEGDRYFKVHRPNHNLDRCRNQFALLRSIQAHREEIRRILS